MAEILFWRKRNTAIGGMYEQLSRPGAQAVITFAEANSGDNHLVQSFKTAFASLQKVREPLYWHLEKRTAI